VAGKGKCGRRVKRGGLWPAGRSHPGRRPTIRRGADRPTIRRAADRPAGGPQTSQPELGKELTASAVRARIYQLYGNSGPARSEKQTGGRGASARVRRRRAGQLWSPRQAGPPSTGRGSCNWAYFATSACHGQQRCIGLCREPRATPRNPVPRRETGVPRRETGVPRRETGVPRRETGVPRQQPAVSRQRSFSHTQEYRQSSGLAPLARPATPRRPSLRTY
jgi:hypothetical protein